MICLGSKNYMHQAWSAIVGCISMAYSMYSIAERKVTFKCLPDGLTFGNTRFWVLWHFFVEISGIYGTCSRYNQQLSNDISGLYQTPLVANWPFVSSTHYPRALWVLEYKAGHSYILTNLEHWTAECSQSHARLHGFSNVNLCH